MSNLYLKQTLPFLYKSSVDRTIDLSKLRIGVSFSLYGNIQKYIGGLVENCKRINEVYPNFWIYVYLGNDFDRSFMDNKFNNIKNIEFIETGKSGHEVMSYRFFTIDRPEVGIAFSRDADSEINERDQYCINRFIESDYMFQIIRDNPAHGLFILGGTWGIKKGLLHDKIENLFNKYKSEKSVHKFGNDQDFLGYCIYPFVKDHSISFDKYFQFKGEYIEQIPLPIRVDPSGTQHFVGSPVYLYK